MRAPGASSAPLAGRAVAGLIGVLTAEGADVPVTRFLAPQPAGRASFDVLSYPASEAQPDGGTSMPAPPVARVGLGVEAALQEAVRLAEHELSRVQVVSVAPGGLRRLVLERPEAGAFEFVFPDEDAFEGDEAARDAAVANWRRLFSEKPGARAAAPQEGLGEALREALADLTLELDFAAIETAVASAVRASLPVGVQSDASGELAGEDAGDDGDLADRVAARITDALEARPLLPTSDLVPGGWVAQATLLSAADQLQIQIESFNDRIRAGSRTLEALADELTSRERAAAHYTEHLARSVDASLSRVAHRIETRLEQIDASVSTAALAAAVRDMSERIRALNQRLDVIEQSGQPAATPR